MSVTYCSACVMPSSHPRVFIDASGICSACQDKPVPEKPAKKGKGKK